MCHSERSEESRSAGLSGARWNGPSEIPRCARNDSRVGLRKGSGPYMKILIADTVSERALEVLTAEKSWDVVFLPKQPNASLAEEIKDADALVVRSATKATAALLERATRLRAIGRAGSGVRAAQEVYLRRTA